MLKSVVCALALLLGASGVARADLMSRALTAADDGGGTTTPPPLSDDLVGWAGAPENTTLPALLQLAIQHAPTLASARIDIKVAEAQIMETWARNDWHITAVATASSQSGFFSGIAVQGDKQFSLSTDLTRALPSGGTIDLHASTQYSDASLMGFDSKGWFDQITGSITQPLLKGRGRALFEANEQKANLARDVTVLARRLVAINAVEAVISAYWDLVLAERQLAITEASLDLARERLRVTQISADGGKTARSEIPAVEQIIATRQEDVLNGELLVVSRSIALRRAAGMPIGAGALGLRVATDLDTPDKNWPLATLLERADAASPELAELEKQGASQTIDIEVTENGLLPQLDAALTFGPTGQETGFTSALTDVLEFKQYAITGSLTFSRSIQQRDTRGRSRELRATRDKLLVNAFDLRAQIAQAMAQAVGQLEIAKRRVALNEHAIELAKENIQIETGRFNLGRSTNFDVLNRLEDLRQAELRKAQAQVDWQKAAIVVLSLTGDVLPTYGITVE